MAGSSDSELSGGLRRGPWPRWTRTPGPPTSTPEQVAALIAGLPTSFDDPRQQVVYELASTLAAARVVPLGLFHRARDLLGDKVIVDVTALMGWFTTVSLTLMAYDVPSDATGLDQ